MLFLFFGIKPSHTQDLYRSLFYRVLNQSSREIFELTTKPSCQLTSGAVVEISHGPQMMSLMTSGHPSFLRWHHGVEHHDQEWNVLQTIRWISYKLGADIHGPKRKHPHDFGVPLTFPILLHVGQRFHVFVEVSRHLHFGLRQNWIQTFIAPRGWIPTTLVIPWRSFHWQYNQLQTFMIPRGWISETIIFESSNLWSNTSKIIPISLYC